MPYDSMSADWAVAALRLAVGIIFVVHGTQKWAMWKMQPTEQLRMPLLRLLRFLSLVEPLGGIALLAGFLTRVAAAGLALIMLGAINLKSRKMHKGFTGDGGWELDFIILAASVALILLGAGGISLDRVLKI